MPLEDRIPGHWVESRLGLCFVSERAYPLSHRHGDLPLGDLLRAAQAPWPERFFRGERFDLARGLFVDTETTGLGRGTGTYCFLVGLAWVQDERLIVRQHFMPDYGDEPLLLEQVREALAERAGLVTFNGLSFDIPLLDTRFVLNGYALTPLARRPHLDLLPVARRLWRRMLDSCALTSLERQVLHVARPESDVPGYLIPDIYQQFLRTGEIEGIAQVFEHNLVDILSMVALTGRAAGVLGGDAQQAHGRYRDPIALGSLYEAEGCTAEAVAAYEQALRADAAATRHQARHRLALLLKRLGRADEAAELWQASLADNTLHPYVELAKYLEHQAHDYAKARALVLLALDGVRQGWLRCPSPAVANAELEHRLRRLERRLAATQGPTSREGGSRGGLAT